MGLLEQGSRPYLGNEGLQQVRFLVISRNLRHITISKKPRAVLRVLSRGFFFCDAPHLTASDKKSVESGERKAENGKLILQFSFSHFICHLSEL